MRQAVSRHGSGFPPTTGSVCAEQDAGTQGKPEFIAVFVWGWVCDDNDVKFAIAGQVALTFSQISSE